MSHEPIHSGHFMTSNPHTEMQQDEDEDVEVEVVDDDIDRIPVEDDAQESDALKDRDEKPVTFYKFGPKKTQSIAIDVSLNKLNKCIKVAYNKMTTPKWKDFKGLRLHWKQRIRLNNVIWRAYYMEFRKPNRTKDKKVPYCYFAVPDEDQTHQKIEGSVLEGMYWKRRMEAVCAQYKRWRYFNRVGKKQANAQRRKRICSTSTPNKSRDPSRRKDNSCSCDADGNMIYVPQPPKSQTPKNLTSEQFEFDDFENVFTDTLFESLNQPYMFPNPKEMAQTGNADIMQPGLLSLQPSLEEIMASLDAPFCMDLESGGMALTSAQSSGPNYSAKEYDTATMLVNYGNQPRPPSHSTGLLASTLPPLYSQASYGRQTSGGFMPDVSESSGAGDYMPQFATLGQGQVGMQQQRPTSWIGPPQPQTWSTGIEDPRFPIKPSTPSKGALKAFPVADEPEKKLNRRGGAKRRVSESKGTYGKADVNRKIAPPQQSSVIHHPTPQQLSPSSTLVQSPQETMMHSPGQAQLAWPFLNASAAGSSGFSPQRLLLVGQSAANVRNAFVSMPQPLYPQVAAQLAMPPPSVHNLGSAFNMNIKQEPNKLPLAPYHSSLYTPLSPPSNSVRSPTEPSTSDGRGGRGQDTNSAKRVAADSTIHPVERKRILHLHAEQSRRTALKDGFEQLMELLPNLYSGGTKPTNAVVLAKAGEYIRDLCDRKEDQDNELQTVKDEIQRLNNKISALQTSLPTANRSGPSTAVQEQGALQQYFDRYVKERSREDWRFWLMARMMQPMFETFKQEVKGESADELAQTGREWAQNNCQLVKMRPITSNTLIYLATNTAVLTDPKSLEDFALQELKRP